MGMFKDYDLPELNAWLDGFINFERRPDKNTLNLSTMGVLCEYFGHPEAACPCFHVAGSKGKGTISHGIAKILREKGFKTGVYASPHVYHFTERIGTGDGPFEKGIYQKAEITLRSGIEELINSGKLNRASITWYELVTIYAMLVFRATRVDYAVYEVGMGGRLDCTNVVSPLAIAMGPIELEHTEYLGDTLAKIATEKAGVFKNKVPVFSAPQKDEVKEVFSNQAAEKNTTVTYIGNKNDYKLEDAMISALAAQSVFKDLDLNDAINAAMSMKTPGRYEIIRDGKFTCVLDGAHTINSVKALLAQLKKDNIRGNLIFACAADKNVEEIAKEIMSSDLFKEIYLTRPGDFKKSDLPRAEEAFRNAVKNDDTIHASPDYTSLIKEAIDSSLKTSTPLIAFGSFYLLSEVKNCLEQAYSCN